MDSGISSMTDKKKLSCENHKDIILKGVNVHMPKKYIFISKTLQV